MQDAFEKLFGNQNKNDEELKMKVVFEWVGSKRNSYRKYYKTNGTELVIKGILEENFSQL